MLYEMLFNHTIQVVLIGARQGRRRRTRSRSSSTPGQCLRQVGFELRRWPAPLPQPVVPRATAC